MSKKGKRKDPGIERLDKVEEERLENFKWKPEYSEIITEEQWNGSGSTKPLSASQRNFIQNNYKILNGYNQNSKFIDNKGKPMSVSKAKMFHIQHIQNRTNRNYSESSKQKEVVAPLTENYPGRVSQLEGTIRRDIPESSEYFSDLINRVENLKENYSEENLASVLASMDIVVYSIDKSKKSSKKTYQMLVDYFFEVIEAIEKKEGIYSEPFIKKEVEEGTPEEVREIVRNREYMINLKKREEFSEYIKKKYPNIKELYTSEGKKLFESQTEEEEKQDLPIPENIPEIKSNVSTNMNSNQLPNGTQTQTMTELKPVIATDNIYLDTVKQVIENEGVPLLTPIKNEAVNIISGALGSVVQTATGSETLGNMASGVINSYMNDDTATIMSGTTEQTIRTESNVEQTIRSGSTASSIPDLETIRSELESGSQLESGSDISFSPPIEPSTDTTTGTQQTSMESQQQQAASKGPQGQFYKDPIHKYALNVYFGSATSPDWDMELFRGLANDPEFQDISGKKMFFLNISRKIVEKFGTEILVSELKYSENSSPGDVLKEHHEILQLQMSRINNRKGPNSSSSDMVSMRLKDLAGYRNLLTSSQNQPQNPQTQMDPTNMTNVLSTDSGYSGLNGSSINIPDKPKVLNRAILNAPTITEERWKNPGVISVKNRKIFGSVKNIVVDKKAARELDSRIDRPGKPEPTNIITHKVNVAPIKKVPTKFLSKDCYSIKMM